MLRSYQKSRLLAVAVATTLLAACDPRTVAYGIFTKLPVQEQLEKRECPPPKPYTDHDQHRDGLLQRISVGPYIFVLPNNFMQIDAHHTHRRGELEVVNGIERPIQVSREWFQLRVFMPDMAAIFLGSSSAISKAARGASYPVEIELFWSEDGSWRPDVNDPPFGLTPFSPPRPPKAASAGLSEYPLGWVSGYSSRFVPEPALPGDTEKIMCTLRFDGSGTCSVVEPIRPDVWVRYSFATADLKCWRDTRTGMKSLLERLTQTWTTVQAKSGG
jgi:hypothetical protein